jgi:Fe2+ transport system protein FeoA
MNQTSFNSLKTLDKCSLGEECHIITLQGKNKLLCKKLLSMGLVSGTVVKVISRAPFGCPLKIEALGYQLSLRLSEAEEIEVAV